jgi:hypothetical protein
VTRLVFDLGLIAIETSLFCGMILVRRNVKNNTLKALLSSGFAVIWYDPYSCNNRAEGRATPSPPPVTLFITRWKKD